MTAGAGGQAARQQAAGRGPEPWPRGISRQATMRISDVLRTLAPEFGDVSHSKLRFLEEQGLITPVRTPSGYRQYSPADVERLRFVLTEQRDSYLPLKVIKDRLAAMDAGDDDGPRPAPRLAPTADEDRSRRRWTHEQVADAAGGVPVDLVEQLVRAGAISESSTGHLGPGAVDVVRIAAQLSSHGIEPRHLRALRTAADRQVALADQVTAPWRGRRSAEAQGHADAMAGEIGELLTRLHAVWVRQGVADL
ncbi:MerR family transcriptional regulator [Myceligenerans crystallogenes]|uniref:MerR family transcriptional regulator n=1 Tax=Myceligenerans crystallogenes TaxID=316335 RepID=A0ABN2N8M3_9MICO